jgi:hypothetical protein
VGNAGSAGAQFQRAIKARKLIAAIGAAHELSWLSLGDALDLLALVAEKDERRYPRAAARWLERLLGERELELGEVQLAAAALAALQGRSAAQAVTALRELVNRPRRSSERRIPSTSSDRRQ